MNTVFCNPLINNLLASAQHLVAIRILKEKSIYDEIMQFTLNCYAIVSVSRVEEQI